MSDFEDSLNSILNDPDKMQSIASMAKSLMGGDASESVPDIDTGALKKLMGSGDNRDTKLLEAMRPYLSEKRRSKMDRALKIARLASLAELAAGEGDADV